MNHPRSLVLLAALQFFVTAGAPAQSNPANIVPLPSTGYSLATLADCSNTFQPDGVLLRNHQVYRVYAAATQTSLSQASSSWDVNSISQLSKSAPGRPDKLLAVGADGLTLGSYDQSGVLQVITLATGYWLNATLLSNRGDTASAVVVGLASNQTRVIVGSLVDSQYQAQVEHSRNMGTPVNGLNVFPFNGNDNAIWVATASQVRVFDQNLTTTLLTLSANSARMAPIARTGEMVLLQQAAGGGNDIVVVSSSGATSTPLHLSLQLAGMSQPTDAFTVPAFASCNDGVAFPQSLTSEVVVLHRQESGPQFALSNGAMETRAYNDPATTPGNMNSLRYEDFDGDGIPDLAGVTDSSFFTIMGGGTTNAPVIDLDWELDVGAAPNDDGYLQVRFHVPSPAPSQPYVEVTVWYEECPLSGDTPSAHGIRTNGYTTNYYTFDPAYGTQTVYVTMTGELNQDFWRVITVSPEYQPHLWFVLRFIDLDDAHNVISASKASVVGATMRNNSHVESIGSDWTQVPSMARLLQAPGTGDPHKGILARIPMWGGIVPVTKVPPTPDGSTPVPAALNGPGTAIGS